MNELVAAQLRAEFDRSFSVAVTPAPACRNFVLVRVNEASYALAADELHRIEPGAALVAVPSREPTLLGIAGLRGEIVPVFSLAKLLGSGTLTRRDDGHWIFALVKVASAEKSTGADGEATLGLAFDELLQFVRVERKHVFEEAAGGTGGGNLLCDGVLYPILSLRPLLERIVHSSTPPDSAFDPGPNPGLHGDTKP